MNKKILIITNRKEQEVDGVIDILRTHSIEVIRWNLCQYPEKEFYTANSGSLLYPKLKAKDSLNLGWLHHFGQFSVEESLTGIERELSLNETRKFIEGVIHSLSCSWYNEPSVVSRASNKLFQLQLAHRLEIPVPPYLITNDSEQVEQFALRQKSIVIKSLATGFINYGGRKLKMYTRRFSDLPKDVFSAINYSPVIVQKEIKKRREFRITVVEEQCFSIEVDHKNLPQTIDVRELIKEKNRKYFRRAVDIPHLEQQSLRLTKELGLIYAGIDWIESENGQYFLLELNPLGSFKWYEQCGKFDITGAISNSILKKIFQ